MITDLLYIELIRSIQLRGDSVITRNGETKRRFDLAPITFHETPLVTVRKADWETAILEMEWFLSGNSRCPDELLKWWKDQLSPEGRYKKGYPFQFRYFIGDGGSFDQIRFIQRELKTNPYSRRLCMTTWNPSDMAHIAEINANPHVPACCHGSFIQFFVSNGDLSMVHYQRSADALIGVPHNLIQYWALLLFFAHHAGLNAGWMRWQPGDAHIYQEDSNRETALELCAFIGFEIDGDPPRLEYHPTSTEFKASDFVMVGEIPMPLVTKRPKLII